MYNYTVEYQSGTVVSSKKDLQTHTYVEGGGGSITAGRNFVGDPVLRGKIEAPTLKTHVTKTHEIFLQLKNGQEVHLVFPHHDIVVREGHYITLIIAFRPGLEGGHYARLFNHTTRMHQDILDNVTWRLLAQKPLPTDPRLPKKTRPVVTGGFFKKVQAWLDYQRDDIKGGWEAAGDVKSPAASVLPVTQAELDRPRAIEFERVVQAALLELWEGRAEQF